MSFKINLILGSGGVCGGGRTKSHLLVLRIYRRKVFKIAKRRVSQQLQHKGQDEIKIRNTHPQECLYLSVSVTKLEHLAEPEKQLALPSC